MLSKLSHLVFQLGNPVNVIAFAVDLNHTIEEEEVTRKSGVEIAKGVVVS
jgi:hypothetical protein